MEIKIRKVKTALTREDGIGDNMWRTDCHAPAIWGVFVDGVEKARLMGGGGGWNIITPVAPFKIIGRRSYDTKKEAIEAVKKMLTG